VAVEQKTAESRRRLPSVDEVLRGAALPLLAGHPRPLVVEAVRAAIARRRAEVGRDATAPGGRIGLSEEEVRRELAALEAPRLRRVVNATGVVLHTNLGRAPLGARVLAHVLECARSYTNLEYDLAKRARGSRTQIYSDLLAELCGAEAALAVNNNAAAMLLALAALAQGGEVVVSRGELVEIGGSFRVPEVMAASGVRLHEVGTTNKTKLSDYERAIGPDTRALLKVHRSNFAIVGFTEEPALEDLCTLGRARGIPAIFDLGSGALFDFAPYGLPGEITARAAVAAGFDLVAFSGDKLLGGPQAGLLVGRERLIAELARHPLHRALRLDRLRLAALEGTLRLYRSGDPVARAEIPTVDMLTCDLEELRLRAARLKRLVARATRGRGFELEIRREESAPGGGSFPLGRLPTWVVAIRHERLSADDLEAALRLGDPPVLARVGDGAVLLDPRTLFPDELAQVAQALGRVEGSR
jgi:L-seryl-tRNA(Ser) seleniumtransferase